MKHKFLLPLALMFLLLPVTIQAEEDDFEEEVAFLEIVQGYYNLVESTHNLHANPESALYSMLAELHEETGDPQKRLELLQTGLDEALSRMR
jgi:hypothetical protein